MGDPASNANIAEVRTTHLQIELEVDFERKVLHGYVFWEKRKAVLVLPREIFQRTN